MTHPFIKQAVFFPLAAMLVPILASFVVPGYSSISQHLSELEVLDHPVATITRGAAIVSGASIVLFGVGLLGASRRYAFTALAAFVFGASMISNGIFVMGSPLHGLYGIGIFMVLTPAFFAAEIHASEHSSSVKALSMTAAVLTMLYMWLMLSGLDPAAYRGLTQRLAIIPIFGWYSLAAYALVRSHSASVSKPAQRVAAGVRG